LSHITGAVKYAHSEVGTLGRLESESPEVHGKTAEQWEIEFLPRPIEESADALVLARWVIRNVAYRHGCIATFAPKIEEGVAGNGMHIHIAAVSNGRNAMCDGQGLSNTARRLIGGLCAHAPSLTAFGNTVSAAYLRLVPNQEAPTSVCWSDSDRGAMVRVPLAWNGVSDLAASINDRKSSAAEQRDSAQTVELRTPDGSAMVHLLLAGIAMSAEWGLVNEESIETAELAYLGRKQDKSNRLASLPRSCVESAHLLRSHRQRYERQDVFSPRIVDYVCQLLESENDDGINARLAALPADDRLRETRKIMHKDLHRQ
ncbi:MAG: glutamine synthetase, partial [Terriglobales bacterium]